MIGFNKPYLSGKELEYISDSVQNQNISGNGKYTKMCQAYLEKRYGFGKCLLTTSCTDALEMAAILLNISEGDEVIMPAFTFVSTANAFVLRGAKIVFADTLASCPNIDVSSIAGLISPKTKAIVVVHYAGMACDMDAVMALASQHNLYVVEDAAQAIDSFFIMSDGTKRPLGTIGHLSAFSFHETKNIISGEGGMLAINDMQFAERAEIIWEKGTNRTAFYRGEVDKYGWVDVGSSFLPSDMVAAYLFAQLEQLDTIQNKRKSIWQQYFSGLSSSAQAGYISLPIIPEYATNNAHMFYIVCKNLEQRSALIAALKDEGIQSVFHYQGLHKSPFYAAKHDGRKLANTELFTDTILRMPFYFELAGADINRVSGTINSWLAKQ
jgi:dTDP-4-amino-4,6-dideoxygalactose transaminase